MTINKHILENGLRIVHHEIQSTQMVTLNIIYNVGARNEDENHTGFAHLFEHLMFGGSVHIPDYDTPLQMAGGDNNAFTTNDYTNYYLTLPASNVETGFWLESDRMLSLAFTPESLEVQRHVVVEEFKQHYINQPYGDTSHLVSEMAYKVHPYRWPTIGLKPEHIEKATMDEVKDFFFRFYTPENAILSVVGNISFEETVRLSEKWFGTIPRRKTTIPPVPQEPKQERQRRKTVYRKVPNDILYMAFHICSRTDKEFHVCDMISDVLANGRSCRLYHNLVERDHVFTSIDAYVTARTDAGMLYIIGMPAEGVNIKDAEAAVWRELDILCREPISDTELEKLKNKYESTDYMERTDNQHLAAQLALFEMYGDANDIDKEVEKYRSVTAEQLRRMCRKVLTRKNSCILAYKKAE